MPGKKKSGTPGSKKRASLVSAGAILPDKLYLQAQERTEAERDAAHMADINHSASPESQPDPPVGDTAMILRAIDALKNSLVARIDKNSTECGLIRADMDKARSRQAEAEQRVSHVEDITRRYEQIIEELQGRIKQLEDRAEAAENRQRRGNVRVLGLPEGSEGNKPEEFAEGFFKDLLNLPATHPTYSIERAHRIPPGPPIPGAPPRPFIAKLLNSRDRDRILTAARHKDKLPFANTEVQLYPDFSAEVRKNRKAFQGVRAALRNKGIKYTTIFPAKLKVTYRDRSKFFTNPAAAEAWMRSLENQA